MVPALPGWDFGFDLRGGFIISFNILLILFAAANSFAVGPQLAPVPQGVIAPVEELTAVDMPYDAGGVVLLKWKAMPYDGPSVFYQVMVSTDSGGPWTQAMPQFSSVEKTAADIDLPFWTWTKKKNLHAAAVDLSKAFPQQLEKTENKNLSKRQQFILETKADKARERYEKGLRTSKYYFKVLTISGNEAAESPVVSAVGKGNWFNMARMNNFIYSAALCIIFLFFIAHAKRKELFLRRIPGLDAVEEAIGRATEMGRPIYYMTGRNSMSSMSTIAATFILGEIAKKVANYETQIKVPHTDAVVMSVCQEIVKQAYAEAGRPDAYREDINFFVTDDQFAYTAAVDGMMTREKPAACFYMGYYYAESLLLTEIGASTGAIQIAGTDAEHQLPFFFTTCDYTLIGEELYAAGAYLSKDPVLVGTLRGQDIGKAFVMFVVIAGLIIVTLGGLYGWDAVARIVMDPIHSF